MFYTAGLILFFSLVLTALSAGTDKYFSAYDGLDPAKTEIINQGLDDAMIVQIFSFRHQDTTIEPKTIINIDIKNGLSNAWFYAFYTQNAGAHYTIMVSLTDTGYSASKINLAEGLDENFKPYRLKTGLKDSLIDSDSLPGIVEPASYGLKPVSELFHDPDVMILTGTDSVREVAIPETVRFVWIIAYGNRQGSYPWSGNRYTYIDAESAVPYIYYESTAQSDNDVDSKFLLNVFPNPADEVVRIQSSGAFTGLNSLTVYNSMGKKIIPAREFDGFSAIGTRELPPGVYFMHLEGRTTVSYPFVIRH